MKIKVTVGSKIQETITLNARKSLDGNLMIFDHEVSSSPSVSAC